MIAGLEDISHGELWIDGEYSNDRTPKDRDIAMVFQSYALYPHMTVYNNMAFGLRSAIFRKKRSIAGSTKPPRFFRLKNTSTANPKPSRVANVSVSPSAAPLSATPRSS
jgi:ABC-type sugar transport system ATPase subunit